MGWLVALICLLLAFAAFGFAAKRSLEIFALHIENGRVRIARGRIPQRLLNDVIDVVKRPKESGTVRAFRSESMVRVEIQGLSEAAAQRLRNAIGLWPLPKILAAPPPRTRK